MKQQSEQALLGRLLFQPDLLDDTAVSVLQPEFFSSDATAALFGWLSERWMANKPIEAALAIGAGIVSQKQVEAMTASPCGSDTVAEHAESIAEAWKQREAIKAASIMADSLGEMGFDAAADGMANKLSNIAAVTVSTISKKMERLEEVFMKAGQAIDGRGLTGIPTGSDMLNRWTGGWQPGHLIVWAGRPSHGKTTNMAAACLEAAKAGYPAAFYTFGDLSPQALYRNLAVMLAGLNVGDVIRGQLTTEDQRRLIESIERLSELPIEIFDRTDCGGDISTIKPHMKVQHRTNGVKIFGLDYLQQMYCEYEAKTRRAQRNQELGAVSRALKMFAETNACPVHLGSQLNRGVETRGGMKIPQMNDLRDTGEIEQDADLILGVRRPAVYSIFEDEEGNDLKAVTIVNVMKFRDDGSLAGVEMMREFVGGNFQDFNPSQDFSPPADGQPAIPVNTTIEPRKRNDDEDVPF